MENKKVLSMEEFVMKVCQFGTDESIYQVIEQHKNQSLVGLFDSGTTWYDVSKDYFKKYLDMFGRTNISL
jgi:hypothetical protein